VPPRLHRQEQVACAGQGRNARVDHDNLCALLAGLPDIVRRDRGAFCDVRAANPDHISAKDVRPRIRDSVDSKRLLIACGGADHAESTVVVNERRLQAHARKLAHQVGLFRGQACATKNGEGAMTLFRLNASDGLRRVLDCRSVLHRVKPAWRSRITLHRGSQSVGMRALQIAFDPLGAKHSTVERKLLPGLKTDDFIVFYFQLNAALLSAETAMRLNQSIWLDTTVQPRACGVSQMRTELLNYVESTYWWLSHRWYPSGCV